MENTTKQTKKAGEALGEQLILQGIIRFIRLEEDNTNLKAQVACHERLQEYYEEKIKALETVRSLQHSIIEQYRNWEKEQLPPHLRLEEESETKQAA